MDPSGGAGSGVRRRPCGSEGSVSERADEDSDTGPMRDFTRWRRCTVCRSRYEPAASAVRNQKVCGRAACRRQRRNQVARRRREREIREYRVDERERQARCRAKRERDGKEGGMSRASLPRQVVSIEQVVLEKWDRLMSVSRASLRREIRMALEDSAQIVGQESAGP